jgi:hypothetical protein
MVPNARKPRSKRLTKTNEHYVDNKLFTEAVTEYTLAYRAAKDAGNPSPRISNYVGSCILKIANHLSLKPNFIGYTSREEMIGDGVENCIMYLHNFNHTKSNAFAYVTQIIFYAFLRRIQKEKKQRYVRHKLIENSGLVGDVSSEMQTNADIGDVDFRGPLEDLLKQNTEDFSCFKK